jgi:hypothetical protein
MNEDRLIGHNYLMALAADIRALDVSVRRSAEQAVRDAIEVGKLLIEAKQALPDGSGKRGCTSTPPSASGRPPHMRIAAPGLKPVTVADGHCRRRSRFHRPASDDRPHPPPCS